MFEGFRFAARALSRWRGGFAVAVVTLAVGIGAITTLYALARVVEVELPGVQQVDRIGRIYAASRSFGVERAPVTLHEYETQLAAARSFVALGAYAQAEVTVGTGALARTATAGYASPEFFRVLGVRPATGRVLSDGDGTGAPVVVLGDELARRIAAEGPVTSMTVDGVSRTVVGTMPREFSYPFVNVTAAMWLPFPASAGDGPAVVAVFGRLAPGQTWSAANAELSRLPIRGGSWYWHAIPLGDDVAHRSSRAYGLTFGLALTLLLIACVNVAMLLLARGISRERELAVRRALGASRGRLVRDLFFEHLVLAIAGGALGVAVADAVLSGVAASLSAAEPMLAGRIPVGASLLPMVLGASVAAAVVFGLVPSIRLSRPGSAVALSGVPSPQRAPREGYGARDLVVFLEVGAAAALVVLAAMALHLFAALNHVRFAVPADRLVVMRVPSRMGEHIESRVRNVRGVADVTLTSGMIGGGGRRVQVEVGGRRVLMSRLPVADRFFDVAGLALVKGRGFLARELQDRARVVVLNATAARAIAPGGNPVGMEVRLAGRSSAGVVIGVCRDAVDYGDLAGTGLPTPEMYVPYDPREIGDVTVLARVTADAHALLAPLAEAVQLPAGTRQPVPAVLADAEHDRDSRAALVAGPLLAALAFVALLLAATGIMAVVGHSVAMRTRELGVRLALGSSPRQLVGLVLGREAKLLAAALASGAGITLLLTNAMFVELARLSVAAPPVWAAFAGVCGIAAVSCVVATWRIVRLEPAVVLRRT